MAFFPHRMVVARPWDGVWWLQDENSGRQDGCCVGVFCPLPAKKFSWGNVTRPSTLGHPELVLRKLRRLPSRFPAVILLLGRLTGVVAAHCIPTAFAPAFQLNAQPTVSTGHSLHAMPVTLYLSGHSVPADEEHVSVIYKKK
eukprot:CAMPEP_0174282826 /NCGR_PEP_ID=MMETSP0809-20121228/3407_1 /TAXON_ID=73025 ORGANISM="Eutreptiella gymnastica-like, Strain CCMP1594" /NCGR_SAMPLE_ID=MMETSP0809 /ASSEMBLY_ACC=CAM_ASM_000658 /LENGTH=141 /DNA_ID=CAMNT_0015377313 /DNA_START=230 /DNA_END=655 /DNA_ORIENTATION=-